MPSAAARRWRRDRVVVERLGVDPVDLDGAVVVEARVAQRLGDRQVGVLQRDVLADERDLHGLVGLRRAARDLRPLARSGGGTSKPKCSQMRSSTPSASNHSGTL